MAKYKWCVSERSGGNIYDHAPVRTGANLKPKTEWASIWAFLKRFMLKSIMLNYRIETL